VDFATEMFVIINSTHPHQQEPPGGLYERVSWAAPGPAFCGADRGNAVQRSGQSVALPNQSPGWPSKQEKWILQAELFNEIHRW
jgi:hypothetical protein